MERGIVVQGRLADAQHIELDEPVTDIEGPLEVALRSVSHEAQSEEEDIFDFIAKLPPGTRSKEDIDGQICEERDSWGER